MLILNKYLKARTTVAAQTEATTMGKRRGRRIHRPGRLAAPTRKSTTHAVGIPGIPTCGNNTTGLITSVRECTPAGICNIALLTSVSERTPVVIALFTSASERTPVVIVLIISVMEGLPRISSIPPPTPLPSKHHHKRTRKHSHTQLSCHSRSPHSPRHTRWTCHAQHSSSDSSLDSSFSSLLLDSSDTQTHLPVQSEATTATDPSTIITAGGMPIGIHLRTAG